MKLDSDELRLSPPKIVDLGKSPTYVKPVYKSKKNTSTLSRSPSSSTSSS